MQVSRIRVVLASAVAAVLITAACNESTAPGFELTVTNNPDDFVALSPGTILNESLDREYTWQNSGTRATVTHGTIVDAGIARIVIRDAVGAIVYDKSLTFGMSEATQVGATGAWRIEVLLSGFSGTFNMRAQKL